MLSDDNTILCEGCDECDGQTDGRTLVTRLHIASRGKNYSSAFTASTTISFLLVFDLKIKFDLHHVQVCMLQPFGLA